MKTLGIDPGITGAWAVVESTPENPIPKLIAAQKLPIIRDGKDKVLEPIQLMQVLEEQNADHLVMERPQAFPRNGAVGNFNFGDMRGCVRTLLILHGKPFDTVQPANWKKQMGLIFPKSENVSEREKKEASITLAEKRFGTEAKEAFFPLKGDHGVAEASLIALNSLENILKINNV